MPPSYFDSEPEKLLKFFHDWPDQFENSHGIALIALTKFGMTVVTFFNNFFNIYPPL